MPDGEENQGVRIEPSFNLGSYSFGKRLEEATIEPRVVGGEPEELYMEDFIEQMYNGVFDAISSRKYFSLKSLRQPTRYFLKDIKNQFLMLCLRKYCKREAILEPLDNEQINGLIYEVGKTLLDLERPIKSKSDLPLEKIILTEPLADMYDIKEGDVVYYHGLKKVDYGRYEDIPESFITKTIEVEPITKTQIYELMSSGWPQDLLLGQMHPTDLMLAHRLKQKPTGLNEYAYTLIKTPGPRPPVQTEPAESPETLSQIE